MYLDFFSFAEKPFDITPAARFFYLSPQHQEIIDTLHYGIRERRGFLLLTGEVGTGKTSSLRVLLNRLDATTETALVINPLLSTLDLLKSIAHDFGIDTPKNEKADSIQETIASLNAFLLGRAREKKNAVVIIDEAQDLSPDSLEMIRLLSNLETESHKLLQIILTGQPELLDKLNRHELRQLRQRIQIECHLKPMSVEDTQEYVLHRVRTAAPQCCLVFEPSAIKRMHAYTGGIPRLINTLGELSLMAAYVGETHVITKGVVDAAFREMKDKSRARGLTGWKKWIGSKMKGDFRVTSP